MDDEGTGIYFERLLSILDTWVNNNRSLFTDVSYDLEKVHSGFYEAIELDPYLRTVPGLTWQLKEFFDVSFREVRSRLDQYADEQQRAFKELDSKLQMYRWSLPSEFQGALNWSNQIQWDWQVFTIKLRDMNRPMAFGMTPTYLSETFGTYLQALEGIQHVIDSVQQREPTPFRVFAMWPGSVNVDVGANEGVRGFLEIFLSWRRDEAKARADKVKAEAEKTKAEAEKTRAETEKIVAETEKAKAEAEKIGVEARKAVAETKALEIANTLQLADLIADRIIPSGSAEEIGFLLRQISPYLKELVTSPIEIVDVTYREREPELTAASNFAEEEE